MINKPISLFVALICATLLTQAQDKTEYVIGITAQGMRSVSVEDVELGFNYQLEQVAKNKNYTLKIKALKNDTELADFILNKKLTGYFGTPILALKLNQVFNLDALFVPELDNKVMQRYVLLVRKDSGISELNQLIHQSLSYCLVDEVGMMFVQKRLNQEKLGNITTFLSKTVVKKNPNLAISAVFFKETKAVLALEADYSVAAELNPQLKTQLIAIEISPEYVTNVLAIVKPLEGPMTLADYESNLANIGSAIQSKKILKSYKYGRLRKINNSDLNSVRELMSDLHDSKGSAPS